MSYTNLLPYEANALFKRSHCLILDMRDEQSFIRDHIEGAQRLSEEIMLHLLRRKSLDREILIYCYHGNSSKDLARQIVDMGYLRVYNLAGGWQGWASYLLTKETLIPASLVAWLKQQGFSGEALNEQLSNGHTPLMQAVLQAETEVIQELITHGADLNVLNRDGNNALWLACFKEDINTMRLLIGAGIDINNRNLNGATCLIYAASAGRHDAVKLLIEAGADHGIVTVDGFSALESAATYPILKMLKPLYRAA